MVPMQLSTPKILHFDKPPILIIGSGMSKRYLSNFKDWEGLLQSVADRIGIEKRAYIAYHHKAEDGSGEYGPLPELATILRQVLLDGLSEGDINAEELFTEHELRMYDEGTDPFKILIASEVSNYTIIDDNHIREELAGLRYLVNTVPAVITTNYDCFLEGELFKEFSVHSSISDYYYYGSDGIGDVFKIHGSAENPSSLVVTSRDYLDYMKRSKILSSKIISMMCDYPLLIMGYSISDIDMTRLINDIVASLDENELQTLQKNILYVVYEEGQFQPEFGSKTFRNEEGEFTLRTVTIADFSLLYRELAEYTPSTTPATIKKLRQLVKRIVLTAEPTEGQYMVVGIDNLNDMDSERITLIVTEKEYGKILRKFEPITPEHLIKDYLSDSPSLNPDEVIRYYSVYSNLQPNMYIPLYYYIKVSSAGPDKNSQKLKEFLDRKEEQLPKRIKLANGFFAKLDVDLENPYKGLRDYNKPMLVVHLLDARKIDIAIAKKMLTDLMSIYGKGNPNFDTNFRCAVTIISKIESE